MTATPSFIIHSEGGDNSSENVWCPDRKATLVTLDQGLHTYTHFLIACASQSVKDSDFQYEPISTTGSTP